MNSQHLPQFLCSSHNKRLPMTLLEILIVLAIIAVATGVVGFNISKAITNQRFQTELSMLVDELRLAQNLMLILGTDIHVKFKQEGNTKIIYWIESESDLPPSMATEILTKRHELKVIKAVLFSDALSSKPKEGELDIRFLSHGDVMSKGVMTLSTTDKTPPPENALQGYICLSGYPKPIASFSTFEAAKKDCESLTDEQFDKNLTEDTMVNYKQRGVNPPETPGALE